MYANDYVFGIGIYELLSRQVELGEVLDPVGQHLHHSLASVVGHDIGHGRHSGGDKVSVDVSERPRKVAIFIGTPGVPDDLQVRLRHRAYPRSSARRSAAARASSMSL